MEKYALVEDRGTWIAGAEGTVETYTKVRHSRIKLFVSKSAQSAAVPGVTVLHGFQTKPPLEVIVSGVHDQAQVMVFSPDRDRSLEALRAVSGIAYDESVGAAEQLIREHAAATGSARAETVDSLQGLWHLSWENAWGMDRYMMYLMSCRGVEMIEAMTKAMQEYAPNFFRR